MKISYLICTHNETDTLSRLLERIINIRCEEDEIIILDDFSNNQKTKEILESISCCVLNVKVYKHELKNDYGSHKNFGIEKCSGDWIFQIDADELPSETLIFNIRDIIETNKNVELIFVPRINDYRGVTQEDARHWGWKLSVSPKCNNRLIVQWPDSQSRIFKNDYPRIHWERKLHEKIVGHNQYAFLPADEDLALYHDKTMAKQLETNLRYNKDFSVDDNKGHKVI